MSYIPSKPKFEIFSKIIAIYLQILKTIVNNLQSLQLSIFFENKTLSL